MKKKNLLKIAVATVMAAVTLISSGCVAGEFRANYFECPQIFAEQLDNEFSAMADTGIFANWNNGITVSGGYVVNNFLLGQKSVSVYIETERALNSFAISLVESSTDGDDVTEKYEYYYYGNGGLKSMIDGEYSYMDVSLAGAFFHLKTVASRATLGVDELYKKLFENVACGKIGCDTVGVSLGKSILKTEVFLSDSAVNLLFCDVVDIAPGTYAYNSTGGLYYTFTHDYSLRSFKADCSFLTENRHGGLDETYFDIESGINNGFVTMPSVFY